MRTRHIPMLLAGVMILASLAVAQAPDVRGTWGPPTEGSPAVAYQLRITEGDILVIYEVTVGDTTAVVPGEIREPLVDYFGMVRAMDAKNRFGPWTDPAALPEHDAGPPGACAQVSWQTQ